MSTSGHNCIHGWVQVDSEGNNLLNTFTLQDMSFQVGWEYISIECDYSAPPANSTTTYSSTTTTWTTPNPTTTSTTSTSTTSTSSTTSTTSSTSTSTSSTTTTTTTEITTTTTSTTSTTSSTTTTTTTFGPELDLIMGVDFAGDAFMVGTTIMNVQVNGTPLTAVYPMADGDNGGGFIPSAPSYLVEVFVDRAASVDPTYVDNNIRIQIKTGVISGPPPAVDTSPSGLTSTAPDVIAFTTTAINILNNAIVITGANNP